MLIHLLPNIPLTSRPGLRALGQGIATLALVLVLDGLGLPGTTHAQTTPLVNVQKVVAGNGHTCALSTSGGVKCWGRNSEGQLGDDSTTDRLTPVDVSGLASGNTALAAGLYHTCSLTLSGGVKCWGDNGNGQLGDNSITRRLIPVEVSGLTSGVMALAAGVHHTCALTSSGGVKCWGHNAFGQLGDNTQTQRLNPVDVLGLGSGVTALAAGAWHTCAVTSGEGVKCWGKNLFGQLGDGSTTQHLTPVDVSGLTSGISAVTAGSSHTCALTSRGGIKCWGFNGWGGLGDNSTTDRLTPVDVSPLASGVAAIAAGNSHTCALVSGGGVKCWGLNDSGQVGDSTTVHRHTPVDVSGLAGGITALAAGDYHTCAVTGIGEVKCWGNGSYGQLGDNSATQRITPVGVSGLASGVMGLAAGGYHNCALTSDGGVKCWGSNVQGQLGDNTTSQRLTPVDVSGLASGMTAIAAGNSHTCALTSSGGVKCWGANWYGQLGDNSTTNRLTPVDVSGLAGGVTAIAAGTYHTCALTSSGGVKCWGYNSNGQLGNNSTSGRLTPVDVEGLTSGITNLAAGAVHGCAGTTGGGVKCWGGNNYGQLGDNSTTDRLTPVDVSGLASGVTAIAAGGRHTCALSGGGGVKCWGHNSNGQLGDNSTAGRLTPVEVWGLASGVTALAAGGVHTCALTKGGGAKCWGYNSNGQLGDNGTTQRLTPVDVEGLTSGGIDLTTGYAHSCALTRGGGATCWGLNDYGQLGDGTAGVRPFPANVVVFVRFTVWEFYNSTLRHYFMTASEAEAQGIDQGAAGPGWSRTGQSFYAYPLASDVAGLSPVCRFYGTPGVGPNSHFYTANTSECEGVKTDPGWFYEGIAFRIAGASGGSCASGGVPVYRVYNGRWRENDSNHRYLTDSGLYTQMQAQGWAGEGVVFCAVP